MSRTSDTGAGTGTDAVPTPTDSPVDNGKRGTQRGGSVRRGADWEGSVRESGFHEWLHAFGLQVTPPSQSSNSDVLWYTLHTIPPASAFDSPGVEASLFGQFIHRNRRASLRASLQKTKKKPGNSQKIPKISNSSGGDGRRNPDVGMPCPRVRYSDGDQIDLWISSAHHGRLHAAWHGMAWHGMIPNCTALHSPTTTRAITVRNPAERPAPTRLRTGLSRT